MTNISIRPEFKVGQIVNFKAYNNQIEAKVIEINPPRLKLDPNDNRIFYRLSGISKPLVSVTTGLSIIESKLYVPWDGSF